VLIVEDNRDAREMFRLMLELEGHEVIEAEEGCARLQFTGSELPDVAFIDVGLPGLDGYEIARRFRRESSLDTRTTTASEGAVATATVSADVRSRNRVLLVALTGYGTPDA
jgi:CheY-like chemotaxis protein